MTPQYRDLQIGSRGLPARFLKEGEGDPLLYLHGAIGSKGWNPSLDILSREYTVYAPLQPGFEELKGLETLHDVVDMALYYFDLLDELGLERVKVVGHFLGGMVATEMAALCPHYIDRLALSAPAGLWRDDAPIPDIFILNDREIRESMWYDPNSPSALTVAPEDESEEDQAQRLLGRTIDLAAAGKLLWPIPDRGLARRIHRVKAPVLLVWGEEDRIVPPLYAGEFASRLDDSERVVIPRCGHLPMLERPEEFAASLLDFFHRR